MISKLSFKAVLAIAVISVFCGTPVKSAENRNAVTVAGITNRHPLEYNT